jgi:hypothetical protein
MRIKVNLLLLLPFIFLVSACASPAIHMSGQEIIALSDDQLCAYSNNYRSESRTRAEIERRGINCDRFYRECLRRGNQPGTQAMDFCIDILRENERLRYDPPYDRFSIFGFSDYDRLRSKER